MKSDPASPVPSAAWFCVRSQPRHEHIAAEHLRQLEGVETFLPRIRFRRKRRTGTAWVTEALFPNYLFARFDWKASLRKVHHAPGVCAVVHFGKNWPTIPDNAIEELRRTLGKDKVYVLDATLAAGDLVQISGGIFHGLQAVITKVMPGRERVMVLLEFLGRQTAVELALDAVVRDGDERRAIL